MVKILPSWPMHLLYLRNVLQSYSLEIVDVWWWSCFLSLPECGDPFYMLPINFPTNRSHKSLCALWSGALGSWQWNFLWHFLAGLYFKQCCTKQTCFWSVLHWRHVVNSTEWLTEKCITISKHDDSLQKSLITDC